MDYKTINNSILRGQKLKVLEKDKKWVYYYLSQNDCALHFAKNVIENPSSIEREINSKADLINKQFIEKLTFIKKLGKQLNIKILLFKTFRKIEDVYAGDIDLILRSKDLKKLISLLRHYGYKCTPDGKKKWECTQPLGPKIEPRSSLYHHGKRIADFNDLVVDSRIASIFGVTIEATSEEIDMFSILVNCLYGPNYLRLQMYQRLISTDQKKIKTIAQKLNLEWEMDRLLKEFLKSDRDNAIFPLFVSNTLYLTFWVYRILFSRSIDYVSKIKHILFFFYFKYKYLIFRKLEFERKWL